MTTQREQPPGSAVRETKSTHAPTVENGVLAIETNRDGFWGVLRYLLCCWRQHTHSAHVTPGGSKVERRL